MIDKVPRLEDYSAKIIQQPVKGLGLWGHALHFKT